MLKTFDSKFRFVAFEIHTHIILHKLSLESRVQYPNIASMFQKFSKFWKHINFQYWLLFGTILFYNQAFWFSTSFAHFRMEN